MFKLYDMHVIKLISEKPNEADLFSTIENRIKINPYMYLLIVKNINNSDEIITGLRNEQDYINYRKEYEYRTLTGKSCFELKKEMLEIQEQKAKSRWHISQKDI